VRVGNVSGVTTAEQPAVAARRGRGRRIAVALAVLGGALLLGGCNAPTFGFYRGATSQGRDTFTLWVIMFSAGLVVSALVWGLILWSVVMYRRRGDEIPRQFREHIPLEISYTIVPFILVIGIFVATVFTENAVDAVAAHPAEVVDVTAFQWGWEFQYHGQHVTIITDEQLALSQLALAPSNPAYPQLVIPEGEATEIVLNSNDVAHSLYVPEFNFSRMALPGATNTFEFTPTRLGVFDGRCNQYCGLYHSEMLFSVKVVTPGQFASWLASEQAAQSGKGANEGGVA
jgi:cytochrome c oxidase subunit II